MRELDWSHFVTHTAWTSCGLSHDLNVYLAGFHTLRTLSNLNPTLDELGIIRLDSRLRYAEYLPYDVRFPVILPRGHGTTKLIVKYYHELANHNAVTNFVLSQTRYWIIAAREEI